MRLTVKALCCALFAPCLAWAQDDGSVLDVKYCGVGYLGQAADLATNYPGLAGNVLSKDGLPQLSGLMMRLSQEANPTLRYADVSGKALSFIIAAADHELQEYKNPLPPYDNRFNSIFSVTVQTMLFDPDSRSVIGIYPWRFTFNEAVAGNRPTDAEIAARFATLFDRPPTEEELAAEEAALAAAAAQTEGGGEAEQPAEEKNTEDTEETGDARMPPHLLLVDWVDALAGLDLVSNPRTLAVAPIGFGDSALQVLDATGPGTSQALSLELSTAFETELAKHLGLSVVPGGGAKAGTAEDGGGAQFTATLPQCLDTGGQAFTLPTPSYRFHLKVDDLVSSEFQHKKVRQSVAADGTVTSEEYQQTEKAYGGRYVLNVVSPDDGDSSEWGGQRVLTDQAFKLVRAKRFSGERNFQDVDQFRKLSLSFLTRLASEFRIADSKWIDKNLSGIMSKKAAKEVQKSWKTLFQERMQLKPTKRKKPGKEGKQGKKKGKDK